MDGDDVDDRGIDELDPTSCPWNGLAKFGQSKTPSQSCIDSPLPRSSQIPPTLPGSSCSPTLTQPSSSQLLFQPQTSSQSPHMPRAPAPAYNRQGLCSLVTETPPSFQFHQETPPSFQFHQIVQSQNFPAPSFRQSVPTNHPAAGVLALLSSTQTPSPLLPPDDVSPTDMASSTFSFPPSVQSEVFIVDGNGNGSVQQVVTEENNSKSKKQKTSKKVRQRSNVFGPGGFVLHAYIGITRRNIKNE